MTFLNGTGTTGRRCRHRGSMGRRKLFVEALEARRVLAMISGQIVHDLDGDGTAGPLEPGIDQVLVYVDDNGNGQLDASGTYVEPDDFADGQDITTPTVGVTLRLADALNQPVAGSAIRSGVDPFASSGDQVFRFTAEPNDFGNFFHETRRLRVDFANPVSSVGIDVIGSRELATLQGTLEAYDSQNNLIGSATSIGLRANEVDSIVVVRQQADIAYVVAHTAKDSPPAGRFDALRINSVGSERFTLSGDDGDYILGGIPGGTHTIRQVVPDGMAQTLPSGNAGHTVTVANNGSATGRDFLNVSTATGSWQNPTEPMDVNDDGFVVPFDVLLIVNELNIPVYGDPVTGELPAPPDPVPFYYDVNGDGFVTPADALIIIDYLNNLPAAARAATAATADLSDVGAAIADELHPLEVELNQERLESQTDSVSVDQGQKQLLLDDLYTQLSDDDLDSMRRVDPLVLEFSDELGEI